jgi:transcriptional regulator GlxA family with amidase domain
LKSEHPGQGLPHDARSVVVNTIVPDFTLATAPAPKMIVIPAQREPSEAALTWIRQASKTIDVTMSVCTGAFVLAKTGLLSGKAATTHHGAYAELAMAFPNIRVKRGAGLEQHVCSSSLDRRASPMSHLHDGS